MEVINPCCRWIYNITIFESMHKTYEDISISWQGLWWSLIEKMAAWMIEAIHVYFNPRYTITWFDKSTRQLDIACGNLIKWVMTWVRVWNLNRNNVAYMKQQLLVNVHMYSYIDIYTYLLISCPRLWHSPSRCIYDNGDNLISVY